MNNSVALFIIIFKHEYTELLQIYVWEKPVKKNCEKIEVGKIEFRGWFGNCPLR